MNKQSVVLKTLLLCIAVSICFPVFAERLEFAEDASPLLHFWAAMLLYSHIAGGAIGLMAGLTASLVKKGARVHRIAGKTFFYAMFISYLIGAGVAPFLNEGQRPNFVAGILALYLLISGVYTARRRPFIAGVWEKVGLVVALTITSMGALFMYMGHQSETGTVDGSPPQAFILFIFAGTVAAAGELNAILRKQLSEKARVTRHLWRMCFSFFIASGSLFFGQPQLFPDWISDTLLPVFLGFLPLLILLIWLAKTRLARR